MTSEVPCIQTASKSTCTLFKCIVGVVYTIWVNWVMQTAEKSACTVYAFRFVLCTHLGSLKGLVLFSCKGLVLYACIVSPLDWSFVHLYSIVQTHAAHKTHSVIWLSSQTQMHTYTTKYNMCSLLDLYISHLSSTREELNTVASIYPECVYIHVLC